VKSIDFRVGDFRDLNKTKFSKSDFIYLDPPYLLGLASYNENGRWGEKDEHDLYTMLNKINKSGIKFALSNVLEHKGKVNNILKNWVAENNYTINFLDYGYKNSNYQSTAKQNKTIEVLVTNY